MDLLVYIGNMELREYLCRSKEQRAQIVKTAEDVVRKSARDKDGSGLEHGPSAYRFKIFEEQVQEEIKKVFYPHLAQRSRNEVKRDKGSSNEKLIKAYSIGFPTSPHKKSSKRAPMDRLTKRKALHSKCSSFDIKSLFTPILSSASSRKSRVFIRSPGTSSDIL